VQALALVATLEADEAWLQEGEQTKGKTQSKKKGKKTSVAAAPNSVSLEEFLENGSHGRSRAGDQAKTKRSEDKSDVVVLDDDEDGEKHKNSKVTQPMEIDVDEEEVPQSAQAEDEPPFSNEVAYAGLRRSKATLVVCPMSLLTQWQSECRAHLADVEVMIYYGSERERDLDRLCNDYDIIITTYGTVTSEHLAASKEQDNSLYNIVFCGLVVGWGVILMNTDCFSCSRANHCG